MSARGLAGLCYYEQAGRLPPGALVVLQKGIFHLFMHMHHIVKWGAVLNIKMAVDRIRGRAIGSSDGAEAFRFAEREDTAIARFTTSLCRGASAFNAPRWLYTRAGPLRIGKIIALVGVPRGCACLNFELD